MTVLWVKTMARDDLDTRTRVFEPFFTTVKERAQGLGLSIVYGVAQALGGDVFIDSMRGTGTCVEVHPLTLLIPPTKSSTFPHQAHSDRCSHLGRRGRSRRSRYRLRDAAPRGIHPDSGPERPALCDSREGLLPGAVRCHHACDEWLDLAHEMTQQGQCADVLISGYAKGDGASAEDVTPLPRITKPFSLNDS